LLDNTMPSGYLVKSVGITHDGDTLEGQRAIRNWHSWCFRSSKRGWSTQAKSVRVENHQKQAVTRPLVCRLYYDPSQFWISTLSLFPVRWPSALSTPMALQNRARSKSGWLIPSLMQQQNKEERRESRTSFLRAFFGCWRFCFCGPRFFLPSLFPKVSNRTWLTKVVPEFVEDTVVL